MKAGVYDITPSTETACHFITMPQRQTPGQRWAQSEMHDYIQIRPLELPTALYNFFLLQESSKPMHHADSLP